MPIQSFPNTIFGRRTWIFTFIGSSPRVNEILWGRGTRFLSISCQFFSLMILPFSNDPFLALYITHFVIFYGFSGEEIHFIVVAGNCKNLGYQGQSSEYLHPAKQTQWNVLQMCNSDSNFWEPRSKSILPIFDENLSWNQLINSVLNWIKQMCCFENSYKKTFFKSI